MSLFGTGRREGVAAVFVLLALVLLARAPALWQSTTPDPTPRATELATDETGSAILGEPDVTAQITLPALAAAGEVWRAGEFPTWNPHHRLGEPFALSGAPVYYPPFWPLMAENGVRFLPWILALHAFLAAVGMYRFLRSQPISRFSSFCGGGFFALGWFFASQEGRLPELAAAAWIPLCLEACWRVLTTRHRDPWGCLLAITLAMPFLAGGFSMALVGVAAAFAMVITHVHLLERSERGHTLRTALFAMVLAIGLTSPCWLDPVAYWDSYVPATPVAPQLTPAALMGFLSPGMAHALDARGPLHYLAPSADGMELLLFPGAAVGFLLLLGLLRGKPGVGTVYWGVIATLGLACTLESPVSRAVHDILAPLQMTPGAFLLWTHIGLTLVAAQGLENFLDNPIRRPWAVPTATAISAAVLMILAAASWAFGDSQGNRDLAEVWQAAQIPLLSTGAAIVVLGLLFCTWRRLGILRFKNFLATVLMGELLVTGWIHREVAAPPPDAATAVATTSPVHRPLGAGRAAIAGMELQTAVDESRRHGGATLHKFGSGMLQSTHDLLSMVDPRLVPTGTRSVVAPLATPQQLDHPLLTAAAVNIGWTPSPHYSAQFATATASPKSAAGSAGEGPIATTRLWPAPRAHVVFEAHIAESETAARDALVAREELLHQIAVVHVDPESAIAGPVLRRPAQPAEVEWLRDGAAEVALNVTIPKDGNGLLVLADAWAPGWTASVSGTDRPVLRTNIGCRGVEVPSGTHEVTFRYQPVSRHAPWSLGSAALLLLLWSIGCAVGWVRPPKFG